MNAARPTNMQKTMKSEKITQLVTPSAAGSPATGG
jgi:hypothetical protein